MILITSQSENELDTKSIFFTCTRIGIVKKCNFNRLLTVKNIFILIVKIISNRITKVAISSILIILLLF